MTIYGVPLDSIAAVLDWLGIVVFATTGALAASRRQMDIVGFALLATVTGIGGGTLRDVLLGALPVFWIATPAYLVVCVCVAVVLFFTAHIPESRLRLLLWLDGIGLALFAVIGAEKALATGAGGIVAVAMGTITATFGGIIRDVLCGETPVVLSREIYVLAALLAAVVFVVGVSAGLGRDLSLIGGFAAGLVLRSVALAFRLSLPRYRSRPPK